MFVGVFVGVNVGVKKTKNGRSRKILFPVEFMKSQIATLPRRE
jgi:hypothetical protein